MGVAGNTNNPNTDWPTNMSIESSVFFGGPIAPTEPMEACTPTTCASGNDDFGFDEAASIMAAARMNTTDMDPTFPATLTGAVISSTPSYVPGNAAAVNGKATPPAPLDTTATYAGAVAPGHGRRRRLVRRLDSVPGEVDRDDDTAARTRAAVCASGMLRSCYRLPRRDEI